MSKSADATDLEERLIREGGGGSPVLSLLFNLIAFPFKLIFKMLKGGSK